MPPALRDALRRSKYVGTNLLKNAVAPFVIPMRRSRGCLGMDADLESVVRVLGQLSDGFSAVGFAPDESTVVELGPGRTPEMTAALVLSGARRAVGIDLNVEVPDDALDSARYAGLVEALVDEEAAPFRQAMGCSQQELRRRYDFLRQQRWPVEFASYSGVGTGLEDDSVDLVFSKSVLEHVDAATVPALIEEMHRVLVPGGAAVHAIDLRDHLHIRGDDAVSGDWLDALRYRDALFKAMFSNRSTSINRFRAPAWRELFIGAGFRIDGWFERRFPLSPGFDRSRLQPEWRRLDERVLQVGILTLAARKQA
jgi:SAM-dependent methyltransferase